MPAKTILLVEDNPDDAELIQLAFARNRITDKVVCVSDGIAALDYLFTSLRAPELVLLDLHLPRLSGLEVLERIRRTEATKLQPVVLFTSSTEQKDLLEGYRLGANSYVRKPIEFAQLVDAARSLVFYWTQLNELPALQPVGSR